MESIIPAELRTAVTNAEKALAALKEDFALVQREAATVNDAAANSSTTTAPLDTAIAALDEVNTAKCRVAACFALASLYYSLSFSSFPLPHVFVLSHSSCFPMSLPSQHEVWWSGAPHTRRDEGACACPPVHPEVPDASPPHCQRRSSTRGKRQQGRRSDHRASSSGQGRQARTRQPWPRQAALRTGSHHAHTEKRARESGKEKKNGFITDEG